MLILLYTLLFGGGPKEVQPEPVGNNICEAVEHHDPAIEVIARRTSHLPGNIPHHIVGTSRRHGFDPLFVTAVIAVESRGRHDAKSPAGAVGLMQLMPRTFSAMLSGGNPLDPADNITAGVLYLRRLWDSNFRRPDSLLMAYNGGPGTAIAYGQAKRAGEDLTQFPEEMTSYPAKVMREYNKLQQEARHSRQWRIE